MPVDPDAVLRAGGRARVDLLQHALATARPEVVFVHLARDFRCHPSAAKALALYDQFCAPGAPARLRADEQLPPKHQTLATAVAALRAAVGRAAAFRPTEEQPDPPPLPLAAGYLFDALTAHLLADPDGPVAAVARELGPDPDRPDALVGEPTAAAPSWTANVWCRRVRPALVAAGFPQVASLGQPLLPPPAKRPSFDFGGFGGWPTGEGADD